LLTKSLEHLTEVLYILLAIKSYKGVGRFVFLNFLIVLIAFYPQQSFSQTNGALIHKNGIEYTDILPTHHFGIFSSRIQQRFSIRPPLKGSLQISVSSGNTFHPFVEAYLPKNTDTRNRLRQTVWYNRQFAFVDRESTPAEHISILADAIIKSFNFNYIFRLNPKNELGIEARGYLITNGRFPFSFFTNDETIEWFHSNVAGGEDPFGRKFYGQNQANIDYEDRNGRRVGLDNGDFIFGGLIFRHIHYPQISFLEKKNVHLNLGSQLGLNTSKENASIDVGITANLIKTWKFNSGNLFNIGIGSGLLKKNLLNFDEVVDFGNSAFLGSFGATLEFTKVTQQNNYHAFGLHYRLQSSYNKKKEQEYYKLSGDWQAVSAGWHNGLSTLYSELSAWSFIYTYAFKSYKISMYVSEDLTVHNAPDLQTGISLAFNFN